MALDIKALARTAFLLAKDLGAQAFETVTARINPTTSTDFSSDVESTTWEHEISDLSALRFDEGSERDDLPVEANLKNFLIDVQDLPAGLALAKLDQNGEIEDADGVIWEIYKTEVDPTGSALTFYARRGAGS